MDYNYETKLPTPLTEEEFKKYFNQFKNGDMEARDIIISHNIRLVIKLIMVKFNDTKYEFEELVSIGNIGLIKAVDTYDEKKNKKFSTYASRCITNEILMLLRKDKNKPIIDSLDTPIVEEENDDLKLKDAIASIILTPEENLIDKQSEIIIYNSISETLELLSERDKDVIMMYFGFINGKRYTQKEIAEKYNLSQSYITRLISKILLKLKKILLMNIQLSSNSNITYQNYLEIKKVENNKNTKRLV